MKIDSQTLRRIAHLARLDFEEKAEKEMISSLSEILDWVEKLNELDTEGVEPLTNMAQEVNMLREDKARPSLSHERGLRNAPKKDSNYFRVPKVLE
ncbi:Asp-tRNA(Asn)/Glu-tRNA(Gln) amidotransferase subunit GatC [Xanthovirga aplysinae]|uniref:Asp-tRNA(Asn)/Glu-tRNA(Gln) amidotransferase subunit GatC n=1 Tax=Xanthovirga aplysinae TaxID=2529853 RepID=UPI0012BC3E76|nr:Asp-tRNA(Asn)/Glu-tRNA(Gln) amidotransferase subunit GatC [Xanthovirga aplysinae]MTI29222.1 Asp-tRNA(Asn)/Glu-tRNA(Gln) amidotransferase subunit GatC [Xanthovirga aplysinae]